MGNIAVITRITIPTIVDGAGTCVILGYRCTIHRNGAKVLYNIPCVSFKCTAIQISNGIDIVKQCSFAAISIFYFTRTYNSKSTIISNGVVAISGQSKRTQIKGNSFACRNSDALRYIFSKSDRRLSCINSALQSGSLRHRHDGQHYSHHKQGQRYAYYFFHINLSFLFFVFYPQGVRVCVQTRKRPMGLRTRPF